MSFILNCEPLSNSVWVTIEFFLFLHDYKYPTENTISTLSKESWTVVHVECVPYYPVHSSPLFSVRYLSYTTSCIELIQYRNLSQTYQFLSQRVALILRCIIQGLSSLLVVIATDDVKWQELHLSSAFTHYTKVLHSLTIYQFHSTNHEYRFQSICTCIFLSNYRRIIFW